MSKTLVMTAPKAPTPQQVDALVKKYHDAMATAATSAAAAAVDSKAVDEVKGQLLELVQSHGFRHTEKSKRIAGLHGWAQATTGTRITVDTEAVDKFHAYLNKINLPGISGRFFIAETTYRLVDGPSEVLKTLDLGTRIHNKVASLIALCFKVKTNAPSLKVEWTAAEKPKKSQVA